MEDINNGFFFFCMFFLLWCLVNSVIAIDPFSYDHSLKTECVMKPPRISETLVEDESDKEWTIDVNGAIKEITQSFQLLQGNIYSFSAWVKLKEENDKKVEVVFKTENGRHVHGGEVRAKQGCWSLLKGGIVPDVSGSVYIFFKSEDKEAKISTINVSLKQFSKEEWRSKQSQLVEKIRKSKVRFEVTYENKTEVKGAVISLEQTKPSFLLGCGMNSRILKSKGYRKWFASRFKITSFTNEMKWYVNEKVRGRENYTLADSMLKFSQENGILVKGHNVLWDDPKWQPKWVKKIKEPEDLMNVTLNRINSIMKRYKGKLTGWDVVNENVHWDYFEKLLGANASSSFYNLAHKLDPDVTLFVNEYNMIENRDDVTGRQVMASEVKEKMEEILAYQGNMNIQGAIGAQGHFSPTQPNLAYMRSALDTLGSLGLPIWLTELDMPKCHNQEKYIEEILREAYSHPAVEGIILFAGPQESGFYKLRLADKHFHNTKTGDVIDKLLNEWQQNSPKIFMLNSENEEEEISLLHGHYNVNISHPLMKNLTTSLSLKVSKEMGQRQVVKVVMNV